MATSALQIGEFFTSHFQSEGSLLATVETKLRDLENICSEDLDFCFTGQGFDLAIHAKGIVALKSHLTTRVIPAFHKIYDANSPPSTELIRVIQGGNSPWTVCEFKGTGTSKGKNVLMNM